jgi:hypothetical protein
MKWVVGVDLLDDKNAIVETPLMASLPVVGGI